MRNGSKNPLKKGFIPKIWGGEYLRDLTKFLGEEGFSKHSVTKNEAERFIKLIDKCNLKEGTVKNWIKKHLRLI